MSPLIDACIPRVVAPRLQFVWRLQTLTREFQITLTESSNEENQVRHIFETFHEGWDWQPRFEAVAVHFRSWTTAALEKD